MAMSQSDVFARAHDGYAKASRSGVPLWSYTQDGEDPWHIPRAQWNAHLRSVVGECQRQQLWPHQMNHSRNATHDFMVAFDAEMTDIDVRGGVVMEIGVAVLTTDLVPQASLHIVLHVDCANVHMSEWSAAHHDDPRSYEDGVSLVELCKHSAVTMQQADDEVFEFLSVFHGGRDQKMSLCGNSVWRDFLFIQRDMPKTSSLLHHRVIDCSGARELAKRHCHVHKRAVRPPAPLDVHCAMYDVLDAINFMRWHSTMLLGPGADADGTFPETTLCMLPLHAHRRIGFEALALKAARDNCSVCPVALFPSSSFTRNFEYVLTAMGCCSHSREPSPCSSAPDARAQQEQQPDSSNDAASVASSSSSVPSWADTLKATIPKGECSSLKNRAPSKPTSAVARATRAVAQQSGGHAGAAAQSASSARKRAKHAGPLASYFKAFAGKDAQYTHAKRSYFSNPSGKGVWPSTTGAYPSR